MQFFFVTDLHGSVVRYEKLFQLLREKKPDALFLGGDLLPHFMARRRQSEDAPADFISDFIIRRFKGLKSELKENYPAIFLILGNDDGKLDEAVFIEAENTGLWYYMHGRKYDWNGFSIYGYSYIPPSPFLLKDWEKYDVSRYVDPGCVSPEQGQRTVAVTDYEKKYSTIARDLERINDNVDFSRALMLFHTPPHDTRLDLADLEGVMVDHAPVDPHVGSIAVRRFIEKNQPLVTMHGHIHESSRLSGDWKDMLGATHCFNAAHDGPELVVVAFDPSEPDKAKRILY